MASSRVAGNGLVCRRTPDDSSDLNRTRVSAESISVRFLDLISSDDLRSSTKVVCERHMRRAVRLTDYVRNLDEIICSTCCSNIVDAPHLRPYGAPPFAC